MEHPDLVVVQAETVGGTLKVDQVRELQHSLALTPYEARYRVALLLRFEEAHVSASNALLKTLEEPAPQVVLLVTAESTESLLPTIVSRCEVMRLRSLPIEAVQHSLQDRWELPAEQAQLLAHLSGGRLGYALSLHQAPASQGRRNNWLDEHRRLLASGRVERFAYSESQWKDKEQLRVQLLTWLSLWRDVALRSANASAPIANIDRRLEVEALAQGFGLLTASGVMAAVQRTLDLIDRNVNARLAMDVLMLDLPRVTS
jgi:DNA polymerase-3 subunit delta'